MYGAKLGADSKLSGRRIGSGLFRQVIIQNLLIFKTNNSSVTLYANNTESGDNAGKACSSETKIVAQLAECYNSTWIYYSIDGCDIPSRLPSSSLTLDTSPQPTLAGPATASRTNPPSVNKPASNTGIIVGGIVGGVSVFAIIFFVALYYMRRRFHQKHDPPIPPRFELSHEQSALAELAYAEKPPKTELYAHEPATEMGRNSVYVPPVELPGDAVVGNDKKGMNPLIKVHFSEGNNEKAP